MWRFFAVLSVLAGLIGPGGVVWADEKPSLRADLLLPVPYRTQFDGTPWAEANCGPATIAMVLEAYGQKVSTQQVRDIVNELQRSTSLDQGTWIYNLVVVARRFGLDGVDLYNKPGQYKQWTLADVRAHLQAGHPVLPQVKYPYLPGTAGSSYYGDHFVAIIGMIGKDFIYHDPASRKGDTGKNRVITEQQLLKAWSTSQFPMNALAVAGSSLVPPPVPTLTPTPLPAPTQPPPIPTAIPTIAPAQEAVAPVPPEVAPVEVAPVEESARLRPSSRGTAPESVPLAEAAAIVPAGQGDQAARPVAPAGKPSSPLAAGAALALGAVALYLGSRRR